MFLASKATTVNACEKKLPPNCSLGMPSLGTRVQQNSRTRRLLENGLIFGKLEAFVTFSVQLFHQVLETL